MVIDRLAGSGCFLLVGSVWFRAEYISDDKEHPTLLDNSHKLALESGFRRLGQYWNEGLEIVCSISGKDR